MFYLEKYLFSFLDGFLKSGYLFILLLGNKSSLYTLDIK